MAGKDKDKDDGASKSGSGLIVGVLLATLLAAGGGVFLGWSQFGKQDAPAKHAAKDEHGKPGADDKYTEGSRVRELAPITTNLMGTPQSWIRLEAAVLLAPDEKIEGKDEQELLKVINEDVVAYLRTVPVSAIQGPSGFQSLREDLDERVRIRSEGKVTELIVQSMILE